jgi:hypothetical protein
MGLPTEDTAGRCRRPKLVFRWAVNPVVGMERQDDWPRQRPPPGVQVNLEQYSHSVRSRRR